jgi:hypothetical protein
MNTLTRSDLQSTPADFAKKLIRLVKLEHLFTLTDQMAVVQHARFSVPYKKEGYAVDDSARALVFAVRAHRYWPDDRLGDLQKKLLSFLLTMQEEDGRFHNLMDFSQRIIDEPSVGDHLGRALWATGTVIGSNVPAGMKRTARLIFDRALPHARASSWLRTKAYACLGLHEHLIQEPKDQNLQSNLKDMSMDILKAYDSTKDANWTWFEDVLAYDNPRLSQSMFYSYDALRDQRFLSIAEESLQFLYRNQTHDGKFAPIGNAGWYVKGGRKALFAQQPIEPGAMVEAAAIAYRLTKRPIYYDMAMGALFWFFGENVKGVKVYDEATGACNDGIGEAGLNENQGAESTIAFLLAAYELLESSQGASSA